MARFKNVERDQSLLIPVNYRDQLIPGTIEFAIDDIVENYIDTSIFYKKYSNDRTGAKAYDPSILLKIILLAYSKGLHTSRKIEELCETNILFMAVSGNARPDHSTIASFVSSMKDEITEIFSDILLRCAQLNLIGGEIFALDGCKISSNAAKEMSGTIEELGRKKEKLKTMCISIIESHAMNDRNEERETLEKRIEKYRRKIEKIDTFLKTAEARKGKRGRENKSNITDNESAKMKSNHGMIQGYNGIAVVDDKNQVIVNAEAFGQGQEGDLLPELIDKTKISMRSIQNEWTFENTKVIADTNYFSESNCEYLMKNEIDGYIPDVQFRKRDPRFPDDYPFRKSVKKNLFGHGDFIFNSETNTYICPTGNILKYDGKKNIHGYIGRRYVVKDGSCCTCYRKTECLKKGAKARTVFFTDIAKAKTYSELMIEKIDSQHGRNIYSQRMGIIEPVFANIRYCKSLDRFTMRGKDKVNIQWMLFCSVHNIEKTLKAAA